MLTIQIITFVIVSVSFCIGPLFLFFWEELFISRMMSATNRTPIGVHYVMNGIGVFWIGYWLFVLCTMKFAIVLTVLVVCIEIFILIKIPKLAYKIAEKEREKRKKEKQKD